MLTFKELFIKADNANMEKFIAALTAKISKSQMWSRKEDKENRILGADTIDLLPYFSPAESRVVPGL